MKATGSGDSVGLDFTIFLNYRRSDTRRDAQFLYRAITERWSRDAVFRDIDSLGGGQKYPQVINEWVGKTDVFIVLIGPDWLTASQGERRRLDDPNDWVRLEIEEALADPDVTVFPVTVGGATMPVAAELPEALQELAYIHAIDIHDGDDWDRDVAKLVNRLEIIEKERRASKLQKLQAEYEEFQRAAEERRRTLAELEATSAAAAERDVARPVEQKSGGKPRREPEPQPKTESEPEPKPPAAAEATPLATAGAGPSVTSLPPPAPGGDVRGRVRGRLTRRAAYIAAAAVLVAIAALVAIVIGTRGDNPSPRASAPAGSSGHADVDAIQEELVLAHVPERFRSQCEDAEVPDAEVFIRSVRCRSPFADHVQFSRAHNGDELREYFVSRAEAQNIHFPTSSTCSSHDDAAGEWVRQGVVGHREQRSPQAGGRVLCYRQADRWFLTWTDTATKLLALASVSYPERHGLYRWWSTAAGPGTQLAHEDHGLARFPDSLERELLLEHVPEGLYTGCTRAATWDRNVFLRAVRCAAGGNMADYSYSHSGIALRQYFNNRVTAAGLTSETKSDCSATGIGVGSWRSSGDVKIVTSSRNANGRFLCYSEGGNAYIEWFDVPQVIYGVAHRPNSERRHLYEWWMTHAGPVEHGHEVQGSDEHGSEPGMDEEPSDHR
jgi:hypothetical protein